MSIVLASAISSCIVGCGTKESGRQAREGSPAGGGDARLKGSYILVATEMAGVTAKEPDDSNRYEISGDKMIPPKGKKEEAATIACDPSKNPAEIDVRKVEVGGKTQTLYGIYKLEGDVLTMCLIKSENPAERPKDFQNRADSKAIILVMKKAK